MARPIVLVNTGLVLAVLGLSVWAYVFFTEPPADAAAASVRTVPVLQGTVTASVTGDGNVQSASTASATFQTSGTVSEIRAKVGQVVKKGQVLAKVSPTAAQRDLTAARANLTAAQNALDRAQESDGDTSAAELQVTQAELDVQEAQDAVDGTVLTAPMAGTVVAINGSVGGLSGGSGSSGGTSTRGASGGGPTSGGANPADTTSAGSGGGFVELADLNRLQISAAFSEVDATRLKVGQQATITWNALADSTATGKVAAIDPNATTANNVVTYRATVSLDSVPDGVKVGQTVSVSVVTGSVQNAVYVNSAAVTTIGNRRTVTVLDDNGQRSVRTVEVGLEAERVVQIISGLAVGERVVLISTGSGPGAGGAPAGRGFPGGGFPGGGFPRGIGPGGGGRPAGDGGGR